MPRLTAWKHLELGEILIQLPCDFPGQCNCWCDWGGLCVSFATRMFLEITWKRSKTCARRSGHGARATERLIPNGPLVWFSLVQFVPLQKVLPLAGSRSRNHVSKLSQVCEDTSDVTSDPYTPCADLHPCVFRLVHVCENVSADAQRKHAPPCVCCRCAVWSVSHVSVTFFWLEHVDLPASTGPKCTFTARVNWNWKTVTATQLKGKQVYYGLMWQHNIRIKTFTPAGK